MKYKNLRLFFLFFVCLFSLIFINTFVFAAANFNFTNIRAERSYVPQGAAKSNNTSQANILYFQVKNTGDATGSLKSLSFANSSQTVNFGTGVRTVYWYLDDANTGQFNPSNTVIKSQAFVVASGTTITLTADNAVSFDSLASKGFFIAYDIASNATIAATTNVSSLSVSDTSGTAYTPTASLTVSSNTVTITGLATQTATSLSQGIVVPGDTKIPMMKLNFSLSGEDLVKDTFALIIQNSGNNFANQDGVKTGITKVSLYWDKNHDGVTDNYVLLQTITGIGFSSSSKAIFTAPYYDDSFNLTQSSAESLYIFYDFGEEMQVTSGTTVKAQCTVFSGQGAASLLPISLTRAIPFPDPVSANVAGMSYSTVAGIVPSDSFFGPSTTVPILKFKLQGQNTAVTLNTVVLNNTGSVGYITMSNKTNGITKISIYEDTNGNESYDGAGYGDTLVGYLNLGYGNGQTATSASISINYGTPAHGLLIPSGGTKTLFAIYDLGARIPVRKDTSGNVQSTANALLTNAYGLCPVSSLPLKLGGTLPAVSSPESTVLISVINILIKSTTDITYPNVVQGQDKVGVLSMKIFSDSDVPSASIKIRNSQATFLSNDTGVKKLWLYRDEDTNNAYNTGDTFLSSTSTFTYPEEATLDNVKLIQGDNYLLLLYDVGQIASLDDSKIGAQVANISSSGSQSSVVCGGEKPSPRVPATLTINPKSFTINSVAVDKTEISDTSSPFNVTMRISNVSTGDIQVYDAAPRFYLNNVNGQDMTYQFKITANKAFPLTVKQGESATIIYSVNPATLVSSGNAYIDGYVYYQVRTDNYASVNRYIGQDGYWHLVANSYAQVSLSSSRKLYKWNISDYISNIKVDNGSNQKTFQNYDAIPAHTSLLIYLKDQAKYIDRSQIALTIKTDSSSSTTKSNSFQAAAADRVPTFEYFPIEGYIKILDMGDTSGQLNLVITDLSGNTLTSTSIMFYILDKVKIYNFLSYPNPYLPNQNLIFGFNLTQPAEVNLYVYNSIGQLAWSYNGNYVLGYNEITCTNRNLASGIYIVKLIAKDSLGNRSIATTKMAVY
ncbi:MAG: T9SS type A sorting domain-containing protein [Candidatus Margulisiibacteriota bacterium]|jgi:hypothetical protein